MSTKAHIQPNMKHPAVKRQAWKALESHYKKVSTLHLRQLFAEDPERGGRMAVEAVGLNLDYSKNRITDETLKLCPTGSSKEIGHQIRSWLISSPRKPWANSSLFTSTPFSPKARSGTLIRLISGVSNSAKYWRNASFRNSRARQSPGLTMTARRTA